MFKEIILSALGLVAFSLAVSAQPSNNNCVNAISITNLSGGCNSYDVEGATIDIGTGPCGIFDPNESANVWFNFTAQGSQIEIELTIDPIVDYQINLVEFDGADCDPNVAGVLACADTESLEFNNLEVGENYFVMIAFREGNAQEINICVTNPIDVPGPPNDDPCDAITLSPNGGCHNGTTINANPEVLNPNCPGLSQSSVWYQVTLTGNNNTLEVDLSNISLQGDVSVLIGQFLSGCSGNLTIATNGAYCGPPNTTVTALGLSAGQTYYVGIATSPDEEGNFSICVQQTGPPPGCSENDDCSDAEALGVIPSSSEDVSQPPVCTDGCNIGSSPGISVANCIQPTWGSVFYTFTTDAIAERISISISSDNMQTFGAALFSGTCANPTIITCNTTNNGSLNLTNIFVNPNTTYYLMIASSTGNMGEFDLCISSFDLPEQCIPPGSEPTLEVTNTSFGSPPEGPFQPGEEVTFLYTLPSYQATVTVQWLQGIIPIFGPGWDPSSFDAQGRPINSGLPNSAAGATWSWWDQFAITYNGNSSFYSTFFNDVGRLALCYWTDPDCPNTGLNAGDGLPAGWYAYNPGGGPSCLPNGNPNNGWGDGNSGPWMVEFTLTVRDFSGPEGCSETDFLDLSVRMFTMSDAQIGCWTGGTPNACAGDDFASAGELINQCCQSPIIDLVDEQICSGEQTNIVLTSDQDPLVTYSWTVTAPPSVTGAENGSGSFITQTLINTSNQPQVVFYNVSGINESESCQANTVSIPVTVYPELIVNLGPDIDGCAQGEFQLGQNLNVSGGSFGPFIYQWSGNLGNNPNPTVSPNISTTYTLTVTDQNGCSGTDQIRVTVSPAIILDMSPEREFCEEDSPLAVIVNPTSGQAPFQFNWTTPLGPLTGQEIGATMTGTYQVEVIDANGCTGERSVNITMFETPLHGVFTVPNNIDSICPGEQIDLFSIPAQGLPPYSYTWTHPGGTQDFDQNIVVEFPGLYTFEVLDANGCVYLDSIFLENREPPEPIIEGDQVICENESTVLSLDQSYDAVLWSTGSTDDQIVVSEAGSYSVTVTVGFGCQGESSFILETTPSPTITFEGPSVLCPEEVSNLSVDEVYESYAWEDGSSERVREIIGPGTYSVTVTSSIGCTSSGSFTVGSEDELAFEILPGDYSICPEDSIVLTISDDFASYLWSDSSTAESLFVNAPGVYSVMVVDSLGCSGEQSVEITEFAPPIVEITGDLEFCFETQTELGLTQEYAAYTWFDGSTDSIFLATESGMVYVSVVDFNGCTGADTVMVIELEGIEPQVEGELAFCPGGSTLLSSAGEFEAYQWSTGGDERSVSVFDAGAVTLIVTDELGCSGEVTVEVEEHIPPSPSIAGSTSFCIGNSTTIDAGEGYQTYLWNSGDTTQTLLVSSAGEYSVTVSDLNGCTGEASIEISEEESLMPVINPLDPGFCPGESIELSVSSGFETYLWSTGDQGPIILVDSAGIYEIMVVDQDGCTGTASVEVVEYDPPQPTITGDDEICWDGSTDLDAGEGYAGYLWNTGETVRIIDVLSGGVYSVIVTDDNGCTALAEFEVDQLDRPDPVIIGKLDICTGEQTEIGLTEDYAFYMWSDNSSGSTIVLDEAGQYSVTVTDNSACTAEVSFEIIGNPDPEVEITGSESFCTGFSAVLDAGDGFEAYLWSDAIMSTTRELEVTSGGVYSVTVTDNNGCTAEDSFEVTEADELSPVITGPDRFCSGSPIELSTGNYAQYNWSTGSNTQSITVVEGGTYSVTVVDADGCTGETSFEATEIEPPSADLIGLLDVCNTAEDTSILDLTEFLIGGDISGSWQDVDGSGATGTFPVLDFDGVEPGEYTFRYTTASAEAPCEEATYTVTVLVRDCDCPNPAFTNPGPLCNLAGAVDLNDFLLEPSEGNWSIVDLPAGGSENILVGSILNSDGAVAGNYRIRYTILSAPDNCPLTEERVVVINAPQSAGEFIGRQNICFGESVEFDLFSLITGNDEGGEWTEISNIPSTANAFDAESGIFVSDGQVPGLYRFRYLVQSDQPCPNDEVEVEIMINEIPVADAGEDGEVSCAEPQLQIGGASTSQGSDFAFEWTRNGNPITQSGRLINVSEGGEYVLRVVNTLSQCADSDTVWVDEFTDPITEIGIETRDPVCAGEATGCIFIETIEGGTAPYLFSLEGGVPTAETEFCGLRAGNYLLEAVDIHGCRNQIAVSIIEPDDLFVNLGFNLFVSQGDTVLIPYETNAPMDAIESLDWYVNGELANCSFCELFPFFAEVSQRLGVEVITTEGCSAFDEIFITVTKERKVFAPNVIRPGSNVSSANASFTIYGEEGTLLQINKLRIFNRWGTSVFQRTNLEPNNPALGWDGRFNDEDAQSGIYFFQAEVLYDDNRIELITGEFTLLR
ncbi:MAG: hypothetical protein EA409_01435 [Saprospirales bacterium]|nr:MAG: hypothetical protein EA409_01435 [Saprospirales bacterium]